MPSLFEDTGLYDFYEQHLTCETNGDSRFIAALPRQRTANRMHLHVIKGKRGLQLASNADVLRALSRIPWWEKKA